MRCDDVTRELILPTGSISETEIESHLASCESCAKFAEKAETFDRVWAATQPAEPSEAVFARIWARATKAAEQPVVTRPRWIAPTLFFGVFAAAAGVLLATFLTLRQAGPGPFDRSMIPQGADVPAGPKPVVASLDVDPGEILIIHLNDDGIRAVRRPVNGIFAAADFEILFKAGALQY